MAKLIEQWPNGPRLNVASADEHVPEIERGIQYIKAGARCIRSAISEYECLTELMTVCLIVFVVRMKNCFPTKGSILTTWSPRMLLHGTPLNYKKDLALEFGSYCQVNTVKLISTRPPEAATRPGPSEASA